MLNGAAGVAVTEEEETGPTVWTVSVEEVTPGASTVTGALRPGVATENTMSALMSLTSALIVLLTITSELVEAAAAFIMCSLKRLTLALAAPAADADPGGRSGLRTNLLVVDIDIDMGFTTDELPGMPCVVEALPNLLALLAALVDTAGVNGVLGVLPMVTARVTSLCWLSLA